MDEAELENKLIYRLLKVTFVVALLLLITLISFGSYQLRPTKYFNSEKSTIKCLNGKTYPFSRIPYIWSSDLPKKTIFYTSYTDIQGEGTRFTRGSEKDFDALDLCANGFVLRGEERSSFSPDNSNYTLEVVYSPRGSWMLTTLIVLLGVSMSYITLKIIFETLLYILFGKRFSWKQPFI